MASIGVVYVAYGRNAVGEATESLRSLRKYHSDWPVVTIGDRIPGTQHVDYPDEGKPGRWAKVNLLNLSPFEQTLYLDADTRPRGKLSIGFRILNDGWDLIMVPSIRAARPLHHLTSDERTLTLSELGEEFPVMLNTGVMWFGKSGRMKRLFAEWRWEWLRFKRHDQGALLRALSKCPVRLWILGREFNSDEGEVIEHRFGRAA